MTISPVREPLYFCNRLARHSLWQPWLRQTYSTFQANIMAPKSNQERPHARRELQLRSESTPERGGPDDDKVSRDRTPGSALQPEPQHQGQPYSSGHFPHSLYLPYGDGTDDPHQRFQPPYQQQHPQQSEWQHNRMMFQHQMQQQIIQNQMAQQQLGDFDRKKPGQGQGLISYQR